MFRFFTNFNSDKKLRANLCLDSLGLFVIGIFCLGYALFVRRFAELHLQLPFLDFPIFVGEILLFICLILLIIKWKLNPPRVRLWHYYLSFYLLFVLIKAFGGYFKYGPLAFRHAALFYYPLFAVFSYFFYKKDIFRTKTNIFLLLLIIFIMGLPQFNHYFLLSCFLLSLIFIKTYPRKSFRYLLFSLLLIYVPFKNFFYTSRTMLVSNLVAGTYLMFVLPFVLRTKKSCKIMISMLIFLFLLGGFLLKFEDKNVKPLANLKALIEQYKEYDKIIARGVSDPAIKAIVEMVHKENKVRLYNPEVRRDKEVEGISDSQKASFLLQKFTQERLKKEALQKKVPQMKGVHEEALQKKVPQMKRVKKETLRQKTEKASKEIKETKSLVPESSVEPVSTPNRMPNVFFRLLVWRDMLKEVKEEKAILGFGFGKPFRSRSLETLYWAAGEWIRDSWIAAHNSYIETVYRTGILGILFIIVVIGALVRMIQRAIREKSVVGVLLCGALINWLVAANFLVILELPYSAIPFWSLVGLTFGYLSQLKLDR